MYDLLYELSPEDYTYLIEIIQGPFDQCSNLKQHLKNVAVPEQHTALCDGLERKIRSLGSSHIAYHVRKLSGAEPAVNFRYMIRDTARFLKVPLADRGSERELLINLAQQYTVNVFSDLTPDEQQQILESLGIKRKRAIAFLKKTGGIFAVPVLLQAFGTIVVQGLIKTVLFGWTARLIGAKLATMFFTFLFARIPWWAHTIIPGAWAISIGLTTLQLQGPARRKTVPILLYLGLSCMRLDAEKNESYPNLRDDICPLNFQEGEESMD